MTETTTPSVEGDRLTAEQVRLILPAIVERHDEEWADIGAFHQEGGTGNAPNREAAKAWGALLDQIADYDPVSEDWHPKPALPCKGGATNDHLHFAVSTFLARYKGNNGLEAMREATAPMFAALPCKGG